MLFSISLRVLKKAFLGSGVGLLVDFFEVFGTDVGVNLGGGNIPVAEHFLDAAQIAPPVQQVGGEGVPEGMWADLLVQRRLPDPFIDDIPRPAVGQTQAARV